MIYHNGSIKGGDKVVPSLVFDAVVTPRKLPPPPDSVGAVRQHLREGAFLCTVVADSQTESKEVRESVFESQRLMRDYGAPPQQRMLVVSNLFLQGQDKAIAAEWTRRGGIAVQTHNGVESELRLYEEGAVKEDAFVSTLVALGVPYKSAQYLIDKYGVGALRRLSVVGAEAQRAVVEGTPDLSLSDLNQFRLGLGLQGQEIILYKPSEKEIEERENKIIEIAFGMLAKELGGEVV